MPTAKASLWHKVWQLAWPLIISNASVPLLGLVDNAVLAHLPVSTYLTAVAIGASFLAFIGMSFGFLRMGTTALSAEFERNDPQQILVLQHAIALAFILALILILLKDVLTPLALTFFQAQNHIAQLSQSYINIRFYALPASFILYVITGWFIGQQNSKAPVAILLTTNGLNIILDYILILKLNLASDGAAYATVIAEYSSLLLALYLLKKSLAQQNIAWCFSWHKNWFNKLIKINQNLFLRSLLLLSAFALFTRQGNLLGPELVAANALLMQIVLFASFALDGFAFASEAIAGQAKRQQQPQLLQQLLRVTFIYSGLFALLYALFLFIAEAFLIDQLSSIASIKLLLEQYWLWVIAIPILAMPSYIWDGVFIGCQKISAMRNSMFISVLCIFVPLLWLSDNNHTLWLAFAGLSLSRSVSLALVYYRHRHHFIN